MTRPTFRCRANDDCGGRQLPGSTAGPLRNGELPWDLFDTEAYLADNYAELHDLDRQIIQTLSRYYRTLPVAGLARTLDVGTGPNLYPLMLVSAASRRCEVVELSTSNVDYLTRCLRDGVEPAWEPFWRLCREGNDALPADLHQALARVLVSQGSAFDLPARRYDLVSMFFVAESVTGDRAEFETLCRRFAGAAVPGGHLVAAFMAGMPAYRLAGEVFPALAVDEAALRAALVDVTDELIVSRLPPDPTLPYTHDGVLLLTARARA